MAEKKNSKKVLTIILVLFVISWVALAISSMLFISVFIQNQKLKNSASILQNQVNSLIKSQSIEQKLFEESYQIKRRVANYLEWQYILKDQVAKANRLLKERISKAKELKNDKATLNLLYYNLGLSETLAVNFDQAKKAFEEALQYVPDDAESSYLLGMICSIDKNERTKAINYYKQSLGISPKGTRAEQAKQRIKELERIK
ncbi:MAG: hypothetical protein PHO70_00950 [Candidatus Omnitrophica bacterium]|nr:hypothetical protein [Candidatus Omnitrophota bacterium]